jgi:beta-lactamase class A
MRRTLVWLCLLLGVAAPAVAAPSVVNVVGRDTSKFPGQVSVLYEDLATHHRVAWRPAQSFEAASLIKLPICIEAYCRWAEGKLDMNERLTLRAGDITTFSDALKGAKPGRQYTVRQLCEAMITWSDNTATDVLLRRLGMASINARLASLGLHDTHVRSDMRHLLYSNGQSNVTTANDMAIMLEDIYQKHGMPAKAADGVLDLLKHQHRRHAIPARLPKGTVVANKTGELNDALHDCGVVYGPKGPYILCMLSRGITDKAAARSALQGLSLDIYHAVSR